MISVSLCMIVKNEEDVLERCLDSIKETVDEIIIVDTGSDDKTKDVARRYTDKIFDFRWKDDFAAARNYAFERGSMDYLMWLDADDVVPRESRVKLLRLKAELDPDTDMVMMPYAVSFDENGKAAFEYYRERIVKNGRGFRFQGRVHEVIPPSGKVVYEKIAVEHRKTKSGESGRNLRIYQDMEEKGEYFDSRALYYYGRELMYHEAFEKAADVFRMFLERPDGWAENRIDATRQLACCLYAVKEDEKALAALLQGLEYDVPRGETCCDLGRHFMDRGRYEQAVYWYEQALQAKKVPESGAFIIEECYGFLPAVSLCVCYDRLGDHRRAEEYNELAGKWKPDSPYYQRNKKYFDTRRKVQMSDWKKSE